MEYVINKKYPHLDGCTQIENETEYVASLYSKIDTTKHTYLIDHVFGSACFVPATMIIEIFLEAALWYERKIDKESNRLPHILLNLNIERAIAIPPGESLNLWINILDVKSGEQESRQTIQIVSQRRAKSGKAVGMRLNASCEVVLSAICPKMDLLPVPEIEFQSYSVDPAKWYNYLFPSLKYCFHGSTGNIALSTDKQWFLGDYNCQNKECRFIKGKHSEFLSTPLGNDMCFQYAVFLARYISTIGRLPVGAEKIIISPSPPRDGDVKVLVKALDVNEETATFDIISFTKNNTPIFYAGNFVVRISPYHAALDRKELNDFLGRHAVQDNPGLEQK